MMHKCHSGMLDRQVSPVVHPVKLHYYLLDERLRPFLKNVVAEYNLTPSSFKEYTCEYPCPPWGFSGQILAIKKTMVMTTKANYAILSISIFLLLAKHQLKVCSHSQWCMCYPRLTLGMHKTCSMSCAFLKSFENLDPQAPLWSFYF